LEEEEDKGRGDSNQYGEDIIEPRQVEPARHPIITNGAGLDLAEQLPSARKVPRQEQREKQPDSLDRLNRPEIHFDPAASRAVSKQEQRQGQEKRAE
jgi:hypothetical protein